MCSITLSEKIGINLVTEVVKRNCLRWPGHVLWKDDCDWVKSVMLYELDSVRGRGRLTWNQEKMDNTCVGTHWAIPS